MGAAEPDAGGGGQRIIDPETFESPYGLYEELHAKCPVREEPGIGYLVTKYHDVRKMALNPSTFSSSIAGEDGPRHMGVSPEPFSEEVEALLAEYHQMDNALFTADPPQHTRHRALATKALNPRRVRLLEDSMRTIAGELVDGFIDDGRCEVISQFAIGVPLTVIADTLGVEREDMADFKRWSDSMLAGNLDPLDNAGRARVARDVIEFQNYFLPRIAERRERPRNDLLSDLANAEIQDDDAESAVGGPRKLTDSELLPIMSQILLAGNETTTNLIGNGLVLLLEHPDAMAEIRADYSLIPGFVEEALRYEPPAHCTYRLAKTDTEIAGQAIPAGSMVVPMWGAANQDAEVFPEPRKFDIHRPNARRHLSFGTGAHFCVGSEMARVETRVAFETLFDRLDNIRLAEGAELSIFPTFSTRGFEQIPIEFDPRSDR